MQALSSMNRIQQVEMLHGKWHNVVFLGRLVTHPSMNKACKHYLVWIGYNRWKCCMVSDTSGCCKWQSSLLLGTPYVDGEMLYRNLRLNLIPQSQYTHTHKSVVLIHTTTLRSHWHHCQIEIAHTDNSHGSHIHNKNSRKNLVTLPPGEQEILSFGGKYLSFK